MAVCENSSKACTVYGVFYMEAVIGTLGFSESYEVGEA